MLRVELQKRLGQFQLETAFQADSGEVLALLGASGSGKSVTLQCIAGIQRPDAGYIALNGRVLYDSRRHIHLSPQQRQVGYLFQQYALFPHMTVEQNIACALTAAGKQDLSGVAKLICRMQLEGLEKKRPRQLSGGQQQRVALARALAGTPELLLLDEPFAALDSYLRWQVELELADTLRAFPGPAVFVSHNREEVYRLCDSVCVLEGGKSQEKQSVQHLLDAPGTYAAALLSGCKNFSRTELLPSGWVRAMDWGVDLQVAGTLGKAKWLGVRAHNLRPSLEPLAFNCMACTVDRVIENIFSTVVLCNTPGGCQGRSQLRLELGREQWRSLGETKRLYVQILPQDLLLLRD